MSKKIETKNPEVELANKDWVLRELMDTEGRIEKAFHEQTKYLAQQQAVANEKMDNNVRWIIGLIVTMTIAIILAVLFKN